MSRKKYQNVGENVIDSEINISDKNPVSGTKMVLPEDNVFNIDAKINKTNQDRQKNEDSLSVENHNKFSKFKNVKGNR